MKVNIPPYPDTGGKRKEEIKIHSYDVFSMDHTLSLIIYPMLKEFKRQNTKNASTPWTDHKDFPANLKDTDEIDPNAPEMTGYSRKRWEHLIDELLWTFKQIKNGEDHLDDKKKEARLNHGLYLFGKYYRSLWN